MAGRNDHYFNDYKNKEVTLSSSMYLIPIGAVRNALLSKCANECMYFMFVHFFGNIAIIIKYTCISRGRIRNKRKVLSFARSTIDTLGTYAATFKLNVIRANKKTNKKWRHRSSTHRFFTFIRSIQCKAVCHCHCNNCRVIGRINQRCINVKT